MKLKALNLAVFAATAGLTLTLVGCNGASTAEDPTDQFVATADNNRLAISAISVPVTEDEINSIRASESATVNNDEHTIGYRTLMKTGEWNNGEIFGLVKDYQDQAIIEADGSNYICNGTDDGKGSGLDHVSILQKNNKLFVCSFFARNIKNP